MENSSSPGALPPPERPPQYWFGVCTKDPHLASCHDLDGLYSYRILLVPNAIFLSLFICSLLGFTHVYLITTLKRSKSYGVVFFAAMALGVLAEILGYAARIASWGNQWYKSPFLMQICCLTVGPAFLAAAIYLCLRRIVVVFGRQYSRIPPEYYTRIVSAPLSLFCPPVCRQKTKIKPFANPILNLTITTSF